jgi:uncharacterized membrane protein YvbJ
MAIFITFFYSIIAFSQATPNDLAKKWVQAIKANDSTKALTLIHPVCDITKIKPQIVKRLISGKLDKNYKFETKKLSATKETLKKIFQVAPTHQLTIKYSDKEKYGLGKGFPIANYKGEWFFVLCTKK